MSKLNITLEGVSDVIELETGYVISKQGFSFTDVVEELTEAENDTKSVPVQLELPFEGPIVEEAQPQTTEEAKASPAYKIGDRVHHEDGGYGFGEGVGTITKVNPETGGAKIASDAFTGDDAGKSLYFYASEILGLAEPQKLPSEPSVKVGDRVRVTTDKYGEQQLGDIGTVIIVYTDREEFQVEVDFTKPGSTRKQLAPRNDYSFKDLEVLKGFIVGDRVKVLHGRGWDGEIGTIELDEGSGCLPLKVRYESIDDYDWFDADELSFA